MMTEVHVSPEFQNDLISIADYAVFLTNDSEAAARIVSGLLDTADQLAVFPRSGKKLFLPGGLDSGFRCIVYKRYLIVYRIQNDEVYILRAVHSAQDHMRILFPGAGEK